MAQTRMDILRAERAAREADRKGTADERLSRLHARFRVACTGVDADVPTLCRVLKLRVLEVHLTTMDAPATWVDWEIACILSQALGHGPHTASRSLRPTPPPSKPPALS